MIPRDDEKVKRIVASNIAHYRKECNLTQDELADMIFYSGKSVSKWERGDGMPDVCVLVALADIFGVTVNDMLAEKHKKAHHAQPQLKRNIITLMSLALVWLIATLVYFFIRIAAPQMERAWLAFIIAIPVMFIVAIVLTSLWHPRILRFLSISGLVWGIALALHLSFRIENMFLIYVIAAVLQLLIVLWYLLVNTNLLSGVKKQKRRPAPQESEKPAEAESVPDEN
ncbi:MAG: helix-turn-helix domain-containing protein [Clostridia bacterium]|nr:helix-turn-helix domain-containing protein [Clostridia bacterium]